ncbi:MAG: hypothetical protein IPL49_08215 [Saprospirales bacterium]|nr:hypothetical protein [Saprospirales bacterium]
MYQWDQEKLKDLYRTHYDYLYHKGIIKSVNDLITKLNLIYGTEVLNKDIDVTLTPKIFTELKQGESNRKKYSKVVYYLTDLLLREGGVPEPSFHPAPLSKKIPANILFLIAGIAFGFLLAKFLVAPDKGAGGENMDLNPIEMMQRGQEAFKGMPYVVAFEDFLKAVQDDKWSMAAQYLGQDWKFKDRNDTSNIQVVDSLKKYYRTTYEHSFNYYIPEKVGKEEAIFYCDFGFSDLVPKLSKREEILEQPAAEVLRPDLFNGFMAEIEDKLPDHFEVDHLTKDTLHTVIENYLTSSNFRIQELLFDENIIDLIGIHMNVKPIIPQSTANPTTKPFRRLVKVTMKRENGEWKLEGYFSVNRWYDNMLHY